MRRRIIVVAGLVLLTMHGARGGAVKGIVRGKQYMPQEVRAAAGKYEKRSLKFARKVDYTQFSNFVVYLEPADGRPVPRIERQHVVRQKNAAFIPRVLPVQAGDRVSWPNEDEIFHNVFSVTPGAKFDLGYYRDEVKTVRFDRASRVDIFCSIHKEMHCIILVLDTPWYGRSDREGGFHIADVPAGRYVLTAWHQRMPSLVQEIVVSGQGDTELELVLTVGNTSLQK